MRPHQPPPLARPASAAPTPSTSAASPPPSPKGKARSLKPARSASRTSLRPEADTTEQQRPTADLSRTRSLSVSLEEERVRERSREVQEVVYGEIDRLTGSTLRPRFGSITASVIIRHYEFRRTAGLEEKKTQRDTEREQDVKRP